MDNLVKYYVTKLGMAAFRIIQNNCLEDHTMVRSDCKRGLKPVFTFWPDPLTWFKLYLNLMCILLDIELKSYGVKDLNKTKMEAEYDSIWLDYARVIVTG